MNVDVLVASGAGVGAAHKATSTIPVVFMGITDPIGFGFVKSLARPGGNMTGLMYGGVELNPKRLEIFKEALPQATRFAALATSRHPLYSRMVEQLEAAARSLRVQIEFVDVGDSTPPAIDPAFEKISRGRPHGVLILQHQLFVRDRNRIVEVVAKYGIPAMYELREYVVVGGLMSYAADLPVQYRRAATYVDKIVKGTKPGDLPVEQPTKFELVINRKTAKAFGLAIPPSLLLRADHVIE
jgi:putative ABC transport system substrate-binding protein